ncbi:hypothetical protein ABVK25_000441 [Lepraria finkii]|uniref:Uncharacterized protein n=1 Tax=Lepraria finkii TaxID=1340010 RepID=A0ABR4BQJ4_9LECA
MAILELFMVGIATAFMDSPHSTAARSSSSDSIKTIVFAGNIFLAHRQSLGALFDSIGFDLSKPNETGRPGIGIVRR